MQAISSRKHKALMAALQQLAGLASQHPGDKVSAEAIYQGLFTLSDAHRKYEQLLAELAGTIEGYEKLHHHLRVNILGPQLREIRKMAKETGKEMPRFESFGLALEVR